jgi:hypothetical protein
MGPLQGDLRKVIIFMDAAAPAAFSDVARSA